MFRVVCPTAHPKHLFILDVSSQSSRSPSWVVHLMFLFTITATSDNMLYETGEGIAYWNQVPLERNFGETVWLSRRLNPSHRLSQVMSPRPASTSAVSTLRSTTPTERTTSTLRITSLPQSQRAKPPTVFRSKRQPAVAHNLSQQVRWMLHFTPNRGQLAAGKCCGAMCQTTLMLKKRIQKGKEIEILKVCELCLKEKIWMSTSSRKLTWLFDKNAQLRDDYLKLQRTWKQESGNTEVLIWLLMKPIENLSLADWSCKTLINGLIRLKERKDQFMWRIGKEKPTISRTSCKRLPRSGEITKKKQIEPNNENWRIIFATGKESDNGESTCDSNSGLTEKSTFLVWHERIFRSWYSEHLEHPTFPVNPWSFRVPEKCEAAILDGRVIHGILWVLRETFWNPSCSRRTILIYLRKIRRIWHHHLEEEGCESCKVRQFLLHVLIRALHTWIRACRTGGTYSLDDVMDDPRIQISELHLGKFHDSMECQSWKVNFKTEVCSKSADPQLTMQWIKEAEIAKSIDDLMTSRSVTGRTDFPDYEMLDAMIASALKKLLTHGHFRKWVSVEEQRAQKYDRFSRRATNCIYDLWALSGHGSLRSRTRSIRSIRYTFIDKDVQDFDTRWHRALSAASEIPTEMILVGWRKSQLQDSVQLQTVLAMYEQENIRNNGQPSYSRLKTAVRRHIDQVMSTRNFRARNENLERGTVIKSHNGKKANAERRVGDCYQWKAHEQCPIGDSCSFPSRTRFWKQMRGWTKRTIVLSSA